MLTVSGDTLTIRGEMPFMNIRCVRCDGSGAAAGGACLAAAVSAVFRHPPNRSNAAENDTHAARLPLCIGFTPFSGSVPAVTAVRLMTAALASRRLTVGTRVPWRVAERAYKLDGVAVGLQ